MPKPRMNWLIEWYERDAHSAPLYLEIDPNGNAYWNSVKYAGIRFASERDANTALALFERLGALQGTTPWKSTTAPTVRAVPLETFFKSNPLSSTTKSFRKFAVTFGHAKIADAPL